MPTLNEYVRSKVPPGLAPGNVGPLKEVAWPFKYPVTFNLGIVNNAGLWQYVLAPTFRETQQFQVNQEAGFLLTYISVEGGNDAADLRQQPLTLTIQDAQSRRDFMVGAMPLNSFPDQAHQLTFERPMYLYPRAIMELTLTTFYTGASVTRTVANIATHSVAPRLQVVLSGYRIREQDAMRRGY